MKNASPREIRDTIKQLNRMNLDDAHYSYIKKKIAFIWHGAVINVKPIAEGHRLYRGRLNPSEKPKHVKDLREPRADYVTGYQRCNSPRQPIFYCGTVPRTVRKELNVSDGDILYLSRWTVYRPFSILPLGSGDLDESSELGLINTFFETKFSQPIHEIYSSQYKITAAIAECLLGNLVEEVEMDNVPDFAKYGIGALGYPSVSDGYGSDNLAIKPHIVDNHIKLNYVEELKVSLEEDSEPSFEKMDFSSKFDHGNIEWAGAPLHYTISSPNKELRLTMERDGYVCRDKVGTIVEPG